MNRDTKILNKILKNGFSGVLEELYTINKRDLFQVCKVGVTFEKSMLFITPTGQTRKVT